MIDTNIILIKYTNDIVYGIVFLGNIPIIQHKGEKNPFPINDPNQFKPAPKFQSKNKGELKCNTSQSL